MLNLYSSPTCPVRLARASRAGNAIQTYVGTIDSEAMRDALRVAATLILHDATAFGPVSALCDGRNAETLFFAIDRARGKDVHVPVDSVVETINGATLYMTPRGDFERLIRIHAEHGPDGHAAKVVVYVYGPVDEVPFGVWFDANAMDDCDGIERGRALAATIAFALFDAP